MSGRIQVDVGAVERSSGRRPMSMAVDLLERRPSALEFAGHGDGAREAVRQVRAP